MKRRIFVLAVFASLHLASAVEIIAHRGGSYDAPENTVASFKAGYAHQADACELDIYLTKDGKAVVIHDKNTKRTAGADKPVVEQTLEEIRALDAGSFKGVQWKGEKIPTLAEALAAIPDGKRMFIEIKCGAEILPELENVMRESKKQPRQLTIIGFDYPTMQQAKARFPQHPVYWIVGTKKDKQGAVPPIAELIDKAKSAKLDGLDLDYRFAIDASLVAQVKAAGLGFYVWTVDNPEVAKTLIAAGVDGVTTDRPGWLREQLK
jgi:glycerophosphoryl diester phosphodiesterase